VNDDVVDAASDDWRKHRPDLDVEPMRVVARLARTYQLGLNLMAANLAQFGLTVGEFDVLATLRRSGEPYELSPSQILGWIVLSPAALTNRIDRLEKAGLVERRPDPQDRRGVLVALTQNGRSRIDEAVVAHAQIEAELVAPLTARERRTLDRLLRKLEAGRTWPEPGRTLKEWKGHRRWPSASRRIPP
jgi:DNA-binding MarR family transcriptional regulator